MSALSQHIKAQNDKARAEASADAVLFLPVEDAAHWAEYGITTVEQYEQSQAAELYMEMFKENTGIKPRWIDFSGMSADAINAMIDADFPSPIVLAERQAYEAAERIAGYMECGAPDVATAIRWMGEGF